jgi:alpha-galactosidase
LGNPSVIAAKPENRANRENLLISLPVLITNDVDKSPTGVVLAAHGDGLPRVLWAGVVRAASDASRFAAEVADGAGAGGGTSLLPEHSTPWFGRPGLSGYRVAGSDSDPVAGRDWSPQFVGATVTRADRRAAIEAADELSGLRLRTEVESVAGGAVRARHTLTNTHPQAYVVESLEVVFPLPSRATESLDFSGRHLAERIVQRRAITDGLWLRESRRGRTGHDSATLLVGGTAGFEFGHGEVWGVHVGWSGNHVHRLERLPDGTTTIGGGELLLPGELVLAENESYTTPWVYLAASAEGLDGLAAAFHGYLRSLPTHPSSPRPVNLNVWEAVYFDHDIDRLRELADIAASIGVERYVLDDGWFHGRRHEHAGLGDWWVDESVFPDGLHPIVDHVRGLGMEFGLWFEPEMVNPDSTVFREHPDWILNVPGRTPVQERNQLVLDLSRPEVFDYLLERVDAVLSAYDIGYVKWDHNRDLVDAGSAANAGSPAVHAHTLAYYRLLDELRARHPRVEWESCASGGGRVDLEVLARTERIWVSDMTDALSRQHIQRWTGQLVPPEYQGAHISSEVSHQTGRHVPLPFRAATAFFGHFGIEWDLTEADEAQRRHIAEWIELYKQHRRLLHSGRVVRLDEPDQTRWVHGVVAQDGSAAIIALVQLDDALHTRPGPVRVPGLDPARAYVVSRIDPHEPTDGEVLLPRGPLSGQVLTDVGVQVDPADARHPPRPQTVVLLELRGI